MTTTYVNERWAYTDLFQIYEVSTYGRVRNVKTKHVLSPYRGSRGHLRVKLYHKGIHKAHRVHRLVLEAFVGEAPKGKPFALHLNDVEDDNRLANLAWGSRQENADHAKINGRTPRGSKNGRAKLCELRVRVIRALMLNFKRSEIADVLGVSRSAVSRVIARKTWSHVQ